MRIDVGWPVFPRCPDYLAWLQQHADWFLHQFPSGAYQGAVAQEVNACFFLSTWIYHQFIYRNKNKLCIGTQGVIPSLKSTFQIRPIWLTIEESLAVANDNKNFNYIFCITIWSRNTKDVGFHQRVGVLSYAWTVSLSSRASLSSLLSSCSFSWASMTLSARSRSRSLLRGLGKDGFTTSSRRKKKVNWEQFCVLLYQCHIGNYVDQLICRNTLIYRVTLSEYQPLASE